MIKTFSGLELRVKPIYHETLRAIYFDNGDGSLVVVYKGKYASLKSIVHVRNDGLGRGYIESVLKPKYGKLNYLYRCPNNGMTYDATHFEGGVLPKWHYSRQGHIPKDKALVICVYKA